MKKLIALLLAMTMLLALTAGCGSTSDNTTEAEAETEAETEAEEEASMEEETEETEEAGDTEKSETVESEEALSDSALPDNYPMLVEDGNVTITAFQSIIPTMPDIETYSDLYWWQELTARTGVNFEWNMVTESVVEDQFNLLVAANDLPDLICKAGYYSDGINSAVENDVFVELTPYLEEYAPDYLEVISQEEVYSIVTDDYGNVVGFYEIGMEQFSPNNGVFLRGDLLEEQGLDIPVTYEEYEETLLALQTAYDLEATIYHYDGNETWLSAGFYVKEGFSLDADGSCVYGPVTDSYREFLQLMNRWYEEGLIYQDFYSTTDYVDKMIEYMSTGQSVISFGYFQFADMVSLADESGYFVAGYMPREDPDEQLHLTDGVDDLVQSGNYYAIGTHATEETIKIICMMMNYLYTEEGALFANYGVEGVSFEYDENGDPWYSELITNNSDGLTQTQALHMYTAYQVPCYSDYTKYNISMLTTYADYVDVWNTADNEWDMPEVTLSVAEQDAYNAVSTDVETYLDEVLIKFIIGAMDIDDDAVWQEYLDTLESLGVNTMIEVYTAALERYNAKIS